LVTGAGSGIGRETSGALVDAGFHVVLTGRRQSALDETIEQFNAGDNMSAVTCDISDEASVDALFKAVESEHGRLDVLFNNAGNNVPAMTIDELSVDQWRTVIDVNLTGAFMAARGAFALMRKQNPQGGRIINNGSISASSPRPGSVPYTTSKHAISGLTKTIALDGRPFSIACGQIDIGNTASAMTDAFAKGVPQADGSIKPEPTMNTKHVAEAVVNMANLPLDTNVLNMTIMATNMPLVGRG